MKVKMLTAFVLSAAVFATLEGQQSTAPASGASAIAALDYYEIQQVYARFNHTLDSAEDNGNAFANVFTPDGVFVAASGARYQGRDQLAAFAREDPDKRKGPTNVGHYITNVAIDATPSGARGHGYLLEATQLPPNPAAGARGRGPGRAITEGSSFWDDLIRTPEGWRIKTRTPARPNGPMPAAVSDARPAAILVPSAMPHPFAAQDYADITQLFALFGYGFDSAADNGYQLGQSLHRGWCLRERHGRRHDERTRHAGRVCGRSTQFPERLRVAHAQPGNAAQSVGDRAHPHRRPDRCRSGRRGRQGLSAECRDR